MKLKKYLKTKKVSASGLAKRANVPYVTVWRLINVRGSTPNIKSAIRIENATAGAVTVYDWI